MNPAPPNNPGHQEAQGRPSETTIQRPPWVGADDSLSPETVLNALDALFRASGPNSRVKVGLTDEGDVQALLYLAGKPCSLAAGASVLEALQRLVK